MASRDPRDVGRAVTAEKKAPQLVAVTVTNRDQAVAEQLAGGLRAVMEKNVERYHDQGIPALTFRVVTTEPWLSMQQVEVAVIVGATFVFVFLAAINVVLLVESVKRVN
jgi:hypothetical protein